MSCTQQYGSRLLTLFLLLATFCDSALAGFGIGKSSRAKWPGGVIAYQFAPGFPVAVRDLTLEAMKAWQDSTDNAVRFVERSDEVDYVLIQHPDPNEPAMVCVNRSEAIGRKGGVQNLLLTDPSRCPPVSVALIIHELGHVIGLLHEHQRDDRDQYVTVLWENIRLPEGREEQSKGQFAIIPEHAPGNPLDPTKYGAYDLKQGGEQSGMHYGSDTNSKDRSGQYPTLLFKNGALIPPPRGISAGDVAAVKAIYRKSPADMTFPPEMPLSARIAALMAPYIGVSGSEDETPGAIIGITVNGKREFFSFGTTDVGLSRPPSQTDGWEIGSITKTFTGILLGLFAGESGSPEVYLQTPVGNIFPPYLDALAGDSSETARLKRTITLLQLATHSSGLPRQIPPEMMDPLSNSLGLFVRVLARVPLFFPPGGDYSYSNPGMSLLGNALAESRGRSYRAEVETRLFTPLGLGRTSFARPTSLVNGYRAENGRLQEVPPYDMGIVNAPTGGIYSTAEDMVIYLEALLNPSNNALGAAIRLAKQVRKSYDCPIAGELCGVGLGIERLGSMHFKTGQTPRMASIIAFVDGKAGVVILVNQRNFDLLAPLARKILAEITAVQAYEREQKLAQIAALQRELIAVRTDAARLEGAIRAQIQTWHMLQARWHHYNNDYLGFIAMHTYHNFWMNYCWAHRMWDWYQHHRNLANSYLNRAGMILQLQLNPTAQQIRLVEKSLGELSPALNQLQRRSAQLEYQLEQLRAELARTA